jgi:hypothetical protein
MAFAIWSRAADLRDRGLVVGARIPQWARRKPASSAGFGESANADFLGCAPRASSPACRAVVSSVALAKAGAFRRRGRARLSPLNPLEVKSRGGCQVGRRSFSPEHDPEIEVLPRRQWRQPAASEAVAEKACTHAFSAARDCRPPGGVTRIMRRGRSPASRLPTTGAGFLGICPFCAAVIARERASYNSRRTSRVEINKHTRRLSPRSPWCQRSGYRGRNSDRSCRRQDGPRPRRSYP